MKSASLTVGGIASLLAGACCVGPLVLVSAGFGGAWLSNFQKLEAYRPLFLGAALLALGFAWRAIYRPQAECKPGEVCAIQRVRRGYRIGFWMLSALVAAMFGVPYVAPFFY
jgi:mercuric ion transport protein